MAIKWKSPDRFKPTLLLKRIESIRTLSEEGKASYSGLEVDEYLPTLRSMLQFPPAAVGDEEDTLMWRALSRVDKDLTPETFLSALNATLNEKLAIRETDYIILTSLSLDPEGLPKKLKCLTALSSFGQMDILGNSVHTNNLSNSTEFLLRIRQLTIVGC